MCGLDELLLLGGVTAADEVFPGLADGEPAVVPGRLHRFGSSDWDRQRRHFVLSIGTTDQSQ